MKIFKETDFKNPLYIAFLDSGAALLVYDGYAEDLTGRIYLPVTEETADGDWTLIGWCEKTEAR